MKLPDDSSHLLRHFGRRDVLRWLSAAAVLPMAACTGKDTGDTTDTTDTSDTDVDTIDTDVGDTDVVDTDVVDTDTSETCATIPEETAGPFPGDGTNGANALALAGIVRSDIRSSIADKTGTAAGIPLTVRVRVVDVGCAPLAGRAIYVWQCDRDAEYSLYTLKTQNYLRGVQVTDADGQVTFTSIFPACYPGRWPHIHFEVFETLEAAANGANAIATSQLAFPKTACEEAYATAGYERSVGALAAISFEGDGVFRGDPLQMAETTGNPTEGYSSTLTVGLSG